MSSGTTSPRTSPASGRVGAALATAVSLIVSTLALLLIGPGAVQPASAADGPVAITEAPNLEWGFKGSWRVYAPIASTGEGVVVIPGSGSQPYQLSWPFVSGSYDASTGTTELQYRGKVHWLKYPGWDGLPPDVHALDVTMSDPVVTISKESSTVSVKAVSRQRDTGELEDVGRVAVVSLDVSENTPVVAGGVTKWTGIPSVSNAAANPVFANSYGGGIAVDPVDVTYTGPGGAPDFSEDFDAPGTSPIELTDNKIHLTGDLGTYMDTRWIDKERGIAHMLNKRTYLNEGTGQYDVDPDRWAVYDLFNGEVLYNEQAPASTDGPFRTYGIDTKTQRFFYSKRNEVQTAMTSWMQFNPSTKQYDTGTLAEPVTLPGGRNFVWDSVHNRGMNVARFIPAGVASTDFDHHEWRLNTITEEADGTWTTDYYTLPGFGAELNRAGYQAGATALAVAADGSILVLGDRRQANTGSSVTVPTTVPLVYRIKPGEGHEADVEAIDGLTGPNELNPISFLVVKGERIALVNNRNSNGFVQELTITEDGDLDVGGRTSIAGFEASYPIDFDGTSIDPTDGTVWLGGIQSQKIWGIRNGRVVFEKYFEERHPRGGPLVVGPDGTIYARTNDGSAAGFGGSPIYGWGTFKRLGTSPTITDQPANVAAPLGADVENRQAQFTAAATGTPDPQVQWQVKQPGQSQFTDVDGATGGTLTVNVTRGMNGTQYRALFSNAAGRIATETATLDAPFAPVVEQDLTDASVDEGADATFLVMHSGDPEPTVSWQRRVGGYWQGIAADDENFHVDGATLIVPDTNDEQSGSLFRAKLTNSVGTVYTRSAKLTIKGEEPDPKDAELAVAGPSSANYGSGGTFIATVAGGTGTITVSGVGSAQTLDVVNNKVTYNLPKTTTSGKRTLTFVYSGDSATKGATAAKTVTVKPRSTRTAATWTTTPTKSTAGKLKVTVTPVTAGVKPTGKVTVKLTKSGKTTTRPAKTISASGIANVDVPKLAKGTWTVRATYAPTTNYVSSYKQFTLTVK